MKPIVLPANQPRDRFYLGGARIAEFRGLPGADPRTPEDWIAAVNPLFGEETLGLTVLPDGRYLRDAIAAEPDLWLGPDHVASHGPDAKLLTKLLDPGQRLPVHLHPDGAFARHRLGCAHGKTEAWIMLAPGEVYLGWNRDMAPEEVRALVEDQRTDEMLAAMNRVEVGPGDGVLVPAGTPHAIGEGAFLLEVQEPEDLSVLLEWEGFEIDGRAAGHLGIGFDLALQAADRRGLPRAGVEALVVRAPGGRATRALLPAAAEEFFRATAVDAASEQTLAAGYSVIVVVEGPVTLGGEEHGRGTVLLVPWAAGELTASGGGLLYRCQPPAANPTA